MLGRAVELGAKPVANARAVEALREFKRQCLQQTVPPAIDWVTCGDGMGADALAAAGVEGVRIIAETPTPTTADDTKSATRQFLDLGVDLILFCGGDGTARDIASIAGTRVPLLGIPSGVKMFSGVFAVTPARTAEILIGFLNHELTLVEVEVVDLDEEKYRAGQWAVRYVQNVLTPFEPTFTQVAKQIVAESSDTESKAEIARYVSEMIAAHPQVLFILGAGGTLKTVAAELGVQKTLLGIDAVLNGRLVARDLNERSLLALLDNHPDCRLILSPIGAQGFVLGRGNLQLSPEAIRRIGIANIIVLATPPKLALTPQLRFDTGDLSLDAELVGLGFLSVVTGYRRHRLVKIVG
jgi:predicted polyphosphate/ATP-dependent NAD kinase